MKPVTIIGGGLAGLTLGIALRKAMVPVTLYDAGAYPRHRVCGEFICGIRPETLQSLGIEDIFKDACRHQTIAFFQDQKKLLSATIPRPAYGLSRYALDARLAGRLEALGGTLHQRSKQENRKLPEEGQVWCAGRHVEPSPWIGLKMHFKHLDSTADLELHLGNRGYAGLSGVENGRTNVCGLFRKKKGIRARKSELLMTYLHASGLHHLAKRLESAEPCLESALGISSVKFHKTWRHPQRCQLGDCYAVIPPFTGNGMSLAMESARLAAEPLGEWSRGEFPWQQSLEKINRDIRRQFSHRLRTARFLHPWIYTRPGQNILALLARTRLLPFQHLFAMTH